MNWRRSSPIWPRYSAGRRPHFRCPGKRAKRNGRARGGPWGELFPVVLVQIRGPISPASPVRHLYKPVPSLTPWRRGAAPAPPAGGARGGGAFDHLVARTDKQTTELQSLMRTTNA